MITLNDFNDTAAHAAQDEQESPKTTVATATNPWKKATLVLVAIIVVATMALVTLRAPIAVAVLNADEAAESDYVSQHFNTNSGDFGLFTGYIADFNANDKTMKLVANDQTCIFLSDASLVGTGASVIDHSQVVALYKQCEDGTCKMLAARTAS